MGWRRRALFALIGPKYPVESFFDSLILIFVNFVIRKESQGLTAHHVGQCHMGSL